jgi:hypothetical protein
MTRRCATGHAARMLLSHVALRAQLLCTLRTALARLKRSYSLVPAGVKETQCLGRFTAKHFCRAGSIVQSPFHRPARFV